MAPLAKVVAYPAMWFGRKGLSVVQSHDSLRKKALKLAFLGMFAWPVLMNLYYPVVDLAYHAGSRTWAATFGDEYVPIRVNKAGKDGHPIPGKDGKPIKVLAAYQYRGTTYDHKTQGWGAPVRTPPVGETKKKVKATWYGSSSPLFPRVQLGSFGIGPFGTGKWAPGDNTLLRFLGKAVGRRHHMFSNTVAHRTYRGGTELLFTRTDPRTGKKYQAKGVVRDTGPSVKGVEFDLSPYLAWKLGLLGKNPVQWAKMFLRGAGHVSDLNAKVIAAPPL